MAIWQDGRRLTRVGKEDVEPGEEFEPTDAELQSFGDVIETTDEDASQPDNPEGSDTEDTTTEGEDAGSEPDASEGEDYASMDYEELRQRAVEADTDEINGRSKADEIVDYLESQ